MSSPKPSITFILPDDSQKTVTLEVSSVEIGAVNSHAKTACVEFSCLINDIEVEGALSLWRASSR